MKTINIACSSCGHSVDVPEIYAAGHKIKCANFGGHFVIDKPPQIVSTGKIPEIPYFNCTKPCPYCAELVQEKALKCRHCGEFFQRQAPQADASLSNYNPKRVATSEDSIWTRNRGCGDILIFGPLILIIIFIVSTCVN